MDIESGGCGYFSFAFPAQATALRWADGTPAGGIVARSSAAENSPELTIQWVADEKTLTLQQAADSRKSVYYAADEQRILFSTRLPELLKMCGTDKTRFDPRCVADLIVVGFVAAPRTPYQGIYQLAPGAAIVWRYGDARLEHTCSASAAPSPQTIGVSFSGRAGNIPAQPQLSDNAMLINVIPQLAALTGEAHGDPGLLRLLLRLGHQRSAPCHVHLGYDLDPETLRAATRFKQPWIRRAAQRSLQHYWNEVRYPEIAGWFSPPETAFDGEWIRHLIISERQRVIQQVATVYQQAVNYYHCPRIDEENMGVKVNNENFSSDSPEAANLYCRAVQLNMSATFINQLVDFSPRKIFRRNEKQQDHRLSSLICAMTSLNYLERFHHRLPQ